MTKIKDKNCSKCGNEYPNTSVYFRPSTNCVDGVSNVCRKCLALAKKEWRILNNKYKKGPRQPISYEDRYASDLILRRSMILRQGIIKRSKEKNLLCDNEILTVSYFYNHLKQNPFCECCGVEMDLSFKNQMNDHSPTVDRIIPELGYVISNIGIICWRCNAVKKDGTLSELKNLLVWMLSYE